MLQELEKLVQVSSFQIIFDNKKILERMGFFDKHKKHEEAIEDMFFGAIVWKIELDKKNKIQKEKKSNDDKT